MYKFMLVAMAASAIAFPSSSPDKRNEVPVASTVDETIADRCDDTADKSDLIKFLMLAPTALDRLDLIPKDEDMVYDFIDPPEDTTTTGPGGHIVKADRKSFPPLVGTGVSMALGFLGPCGFNTPHTHPRASEVHVVVKGHLNTESYLEKGARTVFSDLSQYHMTVFPRGAIHTEFNPDCEDAVYVAGFGDEDPGVQETVQGLMALSNDVVSAALSVDKDTSIDGVELDHYRDVLPINVALGVQQCLDKCGLKRLGSSDEEASS